MSDYCHICGRTIHAEPRCECHEEMVALTAKLQAAEAAVEAYRQRLSPAISCPIEEFLGPVKPCPFCGSEGLNLYEDQVECGNCHATAEPGPWQFRDTREITRLQAEVERLRQDQKQGELDYCALVDRDDAKHVELCTLRARVAELEAGLRDALAELPDEYQDQLPIRERIKALLDNNQTNNQGETK